MQQRKKRVLFVGAFGKDCNESGTGGQLYACRSLINSELSENIEWIKLDTYAKPAQRTPFFIRGYKAVARLVTLVVWLITKKIDAVVIFSAESLSLLEKGTMAIISNWFGKQVLFCPRAGTMAFYVVQSKWKWFIRKVFKSSDVVVCQSDYWKKLFSSTLQIQLSKFKVINNWIDVLAYEAIAHHNKNKQASVIPSILFLAWVEKTKGIYDLIEAIKILAGKNLQCKCIIAGNGSELQSVKGLVEKYKIEEYFDFRGWVTGKAKMELLKESDIFVLPTYFEGSPNALLEAMASALPCIASNVNAIPDVIKEGVNGSMHSAGDSKGLALQLEKLIKDISLRKEFSYAAYDTIHHKHQLDAAVNSFNEIFFGKKNMVDKQEACVELQAV